MKSRPPTRERSVTVGLCWLIEHFRLPVATPATRSQLSSRAHRSIDADHDVCHQRPRRYLPSGWISHLRFALHYEPIPLDAYRALFRVVDHHELTEWIRSRPASTAARRAWYLYEVLMEEPLPIPDVAAVAYVDLLSTDLQVTGRRRKMTRQRIYDNLLGFAGFSPLVRKTARLDKFLRGNLAERANSVASRCSPSILSGAAHSLFLQFLTSGRDPLGAEDAERFVAVVMRSVGVELTTKEALIELQNSIVGPHDAESNWRPTDIPNHRPGGDSERPALVSASSDNIADLMNGWMEFVRSVQDAEVPEPVAVAAVAACAFLLIRPFASGNRRIHVVIMHYLLSILRFTSPGSLCCVSAATLKHNDECIRALLRVSAATGSADFDSTSGRDALYWHSYFDATPFVEYVASSLDELVVADLPDAIQFFKAFGSALRSLPASVAPQRAEMLARDLMQHKGKFSRTERARYSDLPNDCLKQMESLVREVLGGGHDSHLASGHPR